MRALAAATARLAESVAVKADRYFADQCRRLGPLDLGAGHAPRRASPSSPRLDRESRRLAAT